jgi:hypothetical protein
LKKWTPHDLVGLGSVATAISTTGSVEVLVARMAPGLDDVVELEEQRLLRGEVLDHRLDDEVAVGEVVRSARWRSRGRARRRGPLRSEPCPLDLLGQRLLEPGDGGVGGLLLA